MPEFGVDLEQVNIKDLGNMEHTVVAQNMIDMVRKTTSELKDTSNQLIILGGEHSLTYGSYLSYPKDTGYVVFDAHYDLRDEYAGTKLSHAAYLRRIVEERGPENIIHVGARAFVKEELEFLTENNLAKSNMKLIDETEFKKLLGNLKIEETVSGGSVANSIVGLSQLGNKVGFIPLSKKRCLKNFLVASKKLLSAIK